MDSVFIGYTFHMLKCQKDEQMSGSLNQINNQPSGRGSQASHSSLMEESKLMCKVKI